MKRYVLVLAVLLAGCGGGDSTTTIVEKQSEPVAEPSSEQFIDAADAICEDFNSELSKYPEVNAAYLKAAEAATAKLASLEPPAELETTWNQYLGALEDQDAAARAGDVAEQKAADNRKEIAGRKLGFAECGTG